MVDHAVHPQPFFQQTYNPVANRNEWQQSGSSAGMSVKQLYLAHILTGLASNPATMLNIEDHMEYALRMAELAHTSTLKAGW